MKLLQLEHVGTEIRLSRKNLEYLLRSLNSGAGRQHQLVRRNGAEYLVVTAEEDADHYNAEPEHIIA